MHPPPDRVVAFISYAREDQHFVRQLADSLGRQGVDVCGDWQLVQGEDYDRQLHDLQLGADILIAVLSPDFIASPACRAEVDLATGLKKRVVPVVHRDPGQTQIELPDALKEPQWAFLRSSDELVTGIQTLVNAINTDVELMPEHRRLLQGAEHWQRHRRGQAYLLRKDSLKRAEDWFRKTALRPGRLPNPTALELEFITASQDARRSGNWLLLIVVSAIAVGMSILAGWAFLQRNEALTQRGIAEAQTHAAENARRVEAQAREEAESNFRLAKKSVDESFSGVQFDLKDVPGVELYRLELLKKARIYYVEFLSRRQGPELDLDSARSILDLALIELELGRDAGAQFQEALRFLAGAVKRHPNDVELQRHLFLAQLDLGASFNARNKPHDGELALRAAVSAGKQLRQSRPTDLKLEMDVYLAENNLATALLQQSKLQEGRRLLEDAKSGFEVLRQRIEDSTNAGELGLRDQLDIHIAGAHFNLAAISGSGVPLARRLADNRRAWSLFEALMAREAGSHERAANVGKASHLMARLLLELGDAGEAEIFAERSFLIRRNLANLFPANSVYQQAIEDDLRFLMVNSPAWKRDLWFHEGASKALQQALESVQSLSELGLAGPENERSLKHRLSIAHLSIGVSLLKPMLIGQTSTISQADSMRAREEFNLSYTLNQELLIDEGRGARREAYAVIKANHPMWLKLCP
jgi:hypothetical protein